MSLRPDQPQTVSLFSSTLILPVLADVETSPQVPVARKLGCFVLGAMMEFSSNYQG